MTALNQWHTWRTFSRLRWLRNNLLTTARFFRTRLVWNQQRRMYRVLVARKVQQCHTLFSLARSISINFKDCTRTIKKITIKLCVTLVPAAQENIKHTCTVDCVEYCTYNSTRRLARYLLLFHGDHCFCADLLIWKLKLHNTCLPQGKHAIKEGRKPKRTHKCCKFLIRTRSLKAQIIFVFCEFYLLCPRPTFY